MSLIFAVQIRDTTYSLSIHPLDWRFSGVVHTSQPSSEVRFGPFQALVFSSVGLK
jgi:hypothetical protein